jgi:type IV pilus assembly protein PilM
MANIVSLSVDIGSKATKLVYIKSVGSERTVLDFDAFETPAGLISDDDGTVGASPEFASFFNQALKKMKVTTKNVIVSIPNAGVITREITLPDVPEKQLSKLIEMEIPHHILVDLKEYTVDYKVLDKRPNQQGVIQYVVFLVAAPLRVVDSHIKLMAACGMDVKKVDFYGNSLSKLIGYENPAQKNETMAVLDIGNNKTDVSICRSKSLRYSRSVPFGRADFDAAVAQAGDSTPVGIEAAFKSFDMLNCTREFSGVAVTAEQIFSGAASGFVKEVMRIFDFYTSRTLNNRIDKVLITGGFSSMKNIDMYLANELMMEAAVMPSIEKFGIDKREDEFQDTRFLYFNCLGATL